jgi:hypothetical protein
MLVWSLRSEARLAEIRGDEIADKAAYPTPSIATTAKRTPWLSCIENAKQATQR